MRLVRLIIALISGAFISQTQAAPSILSPRTLNTTSSTTAEHYLPVIDLGYAKYRAAKYSADGDYYTFTNIRYAAPPVGKRRFQPPEPPEDEEGVNDGSYGFLCHQAHSIQFKGLQYIVPEEMQNEDCLFLDVYVPACALQEHHPSNYSSLVLNTTSTATISATKPKLPVLFWIHGGGFAFGQKDGLLTPQGMMSIADGKMIYVSINYRLGAFGFLAGNEVKERKITNVGLKDQRMALDWVQKYIGSFGGDAGQVAVMGQSAGASSILHHMTAPEPVQFQRAIMQSTAFYPQYDADILESQYQGFAKLTGCKGEDSFKCLMKLDAKNLSQANREYVYSARYGTFRFGPYVDREYVPLLPLFRLGYGQYNKDVHVLAGYTSNEGALFADPTAIKEADFNKLLCEHFPNATEHTVEEIKEFYPPRKLASQRARGVIAEWVVDCNSQYLDEYYPKTFLYKFSIPPGFHSIDLIFTFWRDVDGSSDHSQTPKELRSLAHEYLGHRATGNWISDVSRRWQEWFVSFAVAGNPNYLSTSHVRFPMAKELPNERAMIDVTKNGDFKLTSLAEDGPKAKRCDFWMEGDWTGR
ncbi:Carboxylesterase [Kockiozyma suomiensis]|uniref:Carboxylesterase n=1 Tax=Kockiozyma suomiensis TaxID=1337062 RepID=UPI00334397B1